MYVLASRVTRVSSPGPAGSCRRRIWPLTARTGTRVGHTADPRRPHAGGDHDPFAADPLAAGQRHASHAAVGEVEFPDLGADANLAAATGDRLDKRRGELAGIDRVVVGDVECESQRRRKRRLKAARLAGTQSPDTQSEPAAELELPCQRFGFVGIAGRQQRAAGEVADVVATGRRTQLGHERRIHLRAREPQPQQPLLPRACLGDRRKHPGAEPGRAVAGLLALEHERPQPALAGAPGDGQADHAAADHDDVRCCCGSIRQEITPCAGIRAPVEITAGSDGVWTRLAPATPSHSPDSGINFHGSPYPGKVQTVGGSLLRPLSPVEGLP